MDCLIRSKATDIIQLHRRTQPPFPLPKSCLFFLMKSCSGTIQYVHFMIYAPIIFYSLEVGLIFMNFPITSQLHYRRRLYQPCLKAKQNSTKPYPTPNIPIQLLLVPGVLRSYGQMHSIAISWITEHNLLLILP